MLKKWWFWTIIGLVIFSVFLIAVIIITNINANSKIQEAEQIALNLKDENNKIQEQFKELTDKISTLQKDEEQQKINDKIQDLKENQEELEEDINSKKSEKISLEKEIERLNEDVITAKGKAKTYPAGQLVAGEDFEVGRYKIYEGNSNFIVYSRWGDLEVNTILGDWGVEEYVYTFNEGDEVEAHSSFKMQPIE